MQYDRPHSRQTPDRRSTRVVVATGLLVVAWLIPALAHLFSVAAFNRVPPWVSLTMLLGSALVLLFVRGRTRLRLTLAFAIVCVTAALVAQHPVARNRAVMEEEWRRGSSLRMAETLEQVGEEVARLEDISSSIGDRVAEHLVAQYGDDSETARFATFEVLDSLASGISGGRVLPEGTEIGIQVFDTQTRRVAWAGWPQSTSSTDRMFMTSGKELVYCRDVSLYRILTHMFPVLLPDGRQIATVMVDMPLEVNFRVNNKFLKSTSLAETITYGELASLSFEYYPPTGSLPGRLERFQHEHEQYLERRARVLEEGRRRLEKETGADGGDRELERSPRRTNLTIEDSILTYYSFASNIEPVGEIAGDRTTGLQGRVVVHALQGNPILKVTAISHPFRHYVLEREARDLLFERSFLVLALVIFFFAAMAATERRWERRTELRRGVRAALFVGFIVVLRYALLPFYAISPSSSLKILDPTVFATPLLGGIMRSAGDLMLTAGLFVIALYGLLKILRGPRAEADLSYGRSSDRPVRAWQVVVMGAVMAAVLFGVFELARGFTNTVVVNANPRLLGDTMKVTDVEVLALHLSMFLILTGIILGGILLVWGMFRATRGRGLLRSSLVAFGVSIVVSATTHRWELASISALLLVFVVLAPRFVQREDLVSIVIASFCLVVISSGVAYVFLSTDYDQLRKSFVREKADELLNPSDDWKVVILEDVLGEYAKRTDIRQALRDPSAPGVQRLAFDLWAESPLSLLGYSCALHVLTPGDSVVSDFAVDMPFNVRVAEGRERIDAPGDNEWAVLDLTRNTARGVVRFYRGILNLDELRAQPSGGLTRQAMGKVIVDLPFFFENLEWAARTGPRTPEVLRNVQEGGVAPRVEEPEALLLARLEGSQVHESSSEHIPLGMPIPGDALQRALEGKWPLLKSGSHTFRFIAHETGPDQYLLSGFAVPPPLRHVLRWSTLFSLYLLYTFAILVAIILLGTMPYFKELLPTLTPGRKLGFQQKLLGSFLVVALVPAIILGVFSVNFIKDRFVEENRKEALYKAFSARKALVNSLHGELQFFLDRQNVDALFAPGNGEALDVGNEREVRLLRRAEEYTAYDSLGVAVSGTIEETSADDLFIHKEDGVVYVGVVSAPIRVMRDEWSGDYYVYYGRVVDSEMLGEIAAQVGADVNVYDDGELVASSREGLLAGGFISAIMNAEAFLKVSVLGSDHSLATERAGQYSYQVAYLPVAGWANRVASVSPAGESVPGADNERPASAVGGVGGEQNEASTDPGGLAGNDVQAAMSVPLLFRPESYYAEVQKATSIVLGIFALLFAATIGLGLVLARGIFEPLRALVAGTHRISQGDFSVKLPLRRRDEIGVVVSAFNEMTERVAESQRTLDERRRYLETILENIGTGVISTEADNRIRTVNTAAQRILGITEAEVVGCTAGELVDRGTAPTIFSLLRSAGEMGAPFVTGEVELARGNDPSTIKYMLTRLEVEDRYLGAVFVFEDLTELIQSKKLSAWVEMARQIAHEIKNPLTPIRISTQFMQRAYDQKPEQFERVFREGTETILHQVDVLKRIAGEFSSYGRMQELDVAPHKLGPIVETIITPYRNNPAGVHLSYENGAPDATVLVDPEAVRKICTNLIENALDAMPEGGDLRVSCVENEAVVRLTFRDTGPGLSEEAGRKLFEPYFSTKTTGTGLGLAICRQLSHAMGGDVTLRNVTDGHGVEASVMMRKGA